jgi:hypothetical protein
MLIYIYNIYIRVVKLLGSVGYTPIPLFGENKYFFFGFSYYSNAFPSIILLLF